MSQLPSSLFRDENASEGWMFLDYEDDGRVVTMAPDVFEALYRPDPDDQG
jgi:hypothetical protein